MNPCTAPTPKHLRAAPLRERHAPTEAAAAETPQAAAVLTTRAEAQRTDSSGAPTQAPAAGWLLQTTVRFGPGSATITPLDELRVHSIAPVLRQARDIHIAGFTDDEGSALTNTPLAKARSMAVATQVVRLIGRAVGTSAHPQCCYVAQGSSPEARQANRRAVITMAVPDTESMRALQQRLAADVVVASESPPAGPGAGREAAEPGAPSAPSALEAGPAQRQDTP